MNPLLASLFVRAEILPFSPRRSRYTYTVSVPDMHQ